MGSPLSSFLTEVVMQDLEKRSVTNNRDIRTWNRYVNDILAAVKKDKTDGYDAPKRTILLICEYKVLHVEIQTFIAKYSTSFANIWIHSWISKPISRCKTITKYKSVNFVIYKPISIHKTTLIYKLILICI